MISTDLLKSSHNKSQQIEGNSRLHELDSTFAMDSPDPSAGAAQDSAAGNLEHLGVAARHAILLCAAVTALVAVTELLIGWFANLLSVWAEGLHTLADLFETLIALTLVSLANRPPDKHHPFGYSKLDTLAATIQGLMLTGTGSYITLTAIGALLAPAARDQEPLPAIIAMTIACPLYWMVSSRLLSVAKRTRSSAVYAEAQHLRAHVLITATLLGGLLLTVVGETFALPGARMIDPSLAALLGIYLGALGVGILRDAYRQLADQALPRSERERIHDVLERFRDRVIEVHGLRTRRAGSRRFVQLHLVLDPRLSLSEAYAQGRRVEQALENQLSGAEVLIHLEPADADQLAHFAARGGAGAIAPDQDAHRDFGAEGRHVHEAGDDTSDHQPSSDERRGPIRSGAGSEPSAGSADEQPGPK